MKAAVEIMMVLVVWCFSAMLFADLDNVRKRYPAARPVAVTIWLLVVVVGWGGIAYLALGNAGGLDGAWAWTLEQPVQYRAMLWIFLLPWMMAAWIWRSGMAEGIRVALVSGLALLTIGLSAAQFRRTKR